MALLRISPDCPGIQSESEMELICKIQKQFPGCPTLPLISEETIETLSLASSALLVAGGWYYLYKRGKKMKEKEIEVEYAQRYVIKTNHEALMKEIKSKNPDAVRGNLGRVLTEDEAKKIEKSA